MKKEKLRSKIPDAPGVYFFLGARKEILYIGKATSLKNRVRSYFDVDLAEKRSTLIAQMTEKAKTIEWTVTDSVLEAMILEVNLIRTYKPFYNTLSKDDKSYNHLVITNEPYPRVLVVRAKDLAERFDTKELKYVFGPFPSGQLFREALKIIRRIFKFYDTKKPVGSSTNKVVRGQIDFNRQLGLYPEEHSKREYAQTIRHIKLFFEGKKHTIIKELEKEMMLLAKQEKFEEADREKRKIFALKHINDIALIKDDSRIYRDDKNFRIEAYDIAHFGGKHMVGVMTVLSHEKPLPSEYRKFKINTVDRSNDTAALKEVLTRRFAHREWSYPQCVVVDGSTAQKNVALSVLRSYGLSVPVVGVVKDDRHKPVRIVGPKSIIASYKNAILLANAEAHRFAITYHRSKRTLS